MVKHYLKLKHWSLLSDKTTMKRTSDRFLVWRCAHVWKTAALVEPQWNLIEKQILGFSWFFGMTPKSSCKPFHAGWSHKSPITAIFSVVLFTAPGEKLPCDYHCCERLLSLRGIWNKQRFHSFEAGMLSFLLSWTKSQLSETMSSRFLLKER